MAEPEVVLSTVGSVRTLNKSSNLALPFKALGVSGPGLVALASSRACSASFQQIDLQQAGLTVPRAQNLVMQPTSGADFNSKVGASLLSPSMEDHQKINPNPANLGPQLSLLNLITSQEQSDDPGNMGTTLIASVDLDTGWIIDSETTDHMTYDCTLFNSTTPPPPPWDSIVTANGGVALVTGVVSIALTPTLSLYNCLLGPTLSSHFYL